jgi:hypothetical protein
MNDGETIDGKKEGRWVSYFADGTLQREGEYRGGKKHGLWLQYWPNGNKKSEATFVDGKYSGLYTSFHPNGKRQFQGYYNEARGVPADGTKQGVWCDYADDGETVRRRITYHRGSRTKPDEVLIGPDEEPPGG